MIKNIGMKYLMISLLILFALSGCVTNQKSVSKTSNKTISKEKFVEYYRVCSNPKAGYGVRLLSCNTAIHDLGLTGKTGKKVDAVFAELYALRGEVQIKMGMIDAAETDIETAIELRPDGFYTRFSLSKLLRARKKYHEAIGILEDLRKIQPRNAVLLNNLALSQFDIGEVEKSITSLQAALVLDPDNLGVQLNPAETFRKAGRKDEAMAVLTTLTRKSPNERHMGYRRRGQFHMRDGDLPKAIEDFSEALKYRPKSHPTLLLRGTAYLRTGNLTSALRDLDLAATINESSSAILARRGTANLRAGNFEAARQDFLGARNIRKTWWEAHAGLAWLLSAGPDHLRTNKTEALSRAREAVRLANDLKSKGSKKDVLPRALDALAAAQAENGRFSAAVQTQTQALAKLDESTVKDVYGTEFRLRLDLYRNGKPYRLPLPES